jgi:hypothetical protein
MGKRIFALALLLGSLFFLEGCASDQPSDPNKVSSIPWNRPEKWEGQGPMGSFAPQGGGSPGGSY